MKWNTLRLRSQRFPLQAKERGRDVLNGKAPGEIAGDAHKPATKFRKKGVLSGKKSTLTDNHVSTQSRIVDFGLIF